ncbi:MAG: hypothetical protein ACJ8AO_02950 [Gemmatimonadaceae bacterium]
MSDAEQRFAEWTRREAAGYNRLPDPTAEAVDAMWGRIEGSVARTVAEYESSALGPRPMAERQPRAVGRTWPAWSVGIAAALVFGVGIGRWTAPRAVDGRGPRGSTVIAGRDSIVHDTSAAPPAVVDHLARSVVFLASFREDARSGQVGNDVRERGRDLLTATQILMDSPASQDPRMRALLEDLELVLAQIAQLNQRRGVEEARIATEAMKQRDILPRLRTVVPREALDETVSAAGAGN